MNRTISEEDYKFMVSGLSDLVEKTKDEVMLIRESGRFHKSLEAQLRLLELVKKTLS